MSTAYVFSPWQIAMPTADPAPVAGRDEDADHAGTPS